MKLVSFRVLLLSPCVLSGPACCSCTHQFSLKDKEYYPNIRRCLVSGFFMQIACLESEKRGAYSMLRDGQDRSTKGHSRPRAEALAPPAISFPFPS